MLEVYGAALAGLSYRVLGRVARRFILLSSVMDSSSGTFAGETKSVGSDPRLGAYLSQFLVLIAAAPLASSFPEPDASQSNSAPIIVPDKTIVFLTSRAPSILLYEIAECASRSISAPCKGAIVL